MRRGLGGVVLASVIVLAGRSASGQAAPGAAAGTPTATGAESASAPPAGAPAATASSAVSPPRLLSFVEAAYPAAALAERRESRVVLKLTIDASGAVTAAEIAESGGEDFDAEARRAALSFRFAPATRGGTAVAPPIRRPSSRLTRAGTASPSCAELDGD
jgi:TonB family protein